MPTTQTIKRHILICDRKRPRLQVAPQQSLYETFVQAALHFRNELDLKTAIFALDKAVEMGGEKASENECD